MEFVIQILVILEQGAEENATSSWEQQKKTDNGVALDVLYPLYFGFSANIDLQYRT